MGSGAPGPFCLQLRQQACQHLELPAVVLQEGCVREAELLADEGLPEHGQRRGQTRLLSRCGKNWGGQSWKGSNRKKVEPNKSDDGNFLVTIEKKRVTPGPDYEYSKR